MDKKIETKRLFIFLGFAFLISWIPMIIMDCLGFKWDGKRPELEQLAALGMFAPALSHIFTRWVTREGYSVTGQDSMRLGISFKDKKWIYFLFAMLVPWLIWEIGYGIVLIVYPGSFDTGYVVSQGMDSRIIYILPIVAIVNGVVGSCAAFGEEFGWRGYMMPKMIKLWGLKKAIIFGGIIWGVWHAPLTVVGHNFGTEYPGFPYAGILFMSAMCTFMGMFLTFVTIKSESIWPAAFMHAVFNARPSILIGLVNQEKLRELSPNSIITALLTFIPIFIGGSVCMFVMNKTKND